MKNVFVFMCVLLLIDVVFIYKIVFERYKNWFKSINLEMKYNYKAMFFAYCLMIVVYPKFIENKDIKQELKNAAIIGGIIYGVYGFTLASIFPKFTFQMGLFEMIWGIILYTTSVYITHKLHI